MIKPMIASSPNVEFVGEIGDRDKAEFLGNADALLFPIDWPEPFGLVMIEAMACGTPVIAFRRGSAPEVIDDGVSGFLVDDVSHAVAATGRIAELDRTRAREAFERRFGIERVAREYVQIYRSLANAEEARRDKRATQWSCAELCSARSARLPARPGRTRSGSSECGANGLTPGRPLDRPGASQLLVSTPIDPSLSSTSTTT